MKQKKSNLVHLDYLLIPTGWDEQRKKRAEEEKKIRKIKNILTLNGCVSEEDILELGKKIKGKKRVGIVTFPLHFQEYKEIIAKAQKQKKFPKGIILESIPTEQTFKQTIYGILGLIEERMDKEVNYVKDEHESPFRKKIKRFLKKILR
ncbi:MAG: hypothetical protein AABX99_03495 [Nanoarchaeota archaeon]